MTPTKRYCSYGPEGQRHELPILGYFMEMVKAPQTKRKPNTQVFVISGNAINLLSCETAEKLGLVSFIQKVEQVKPDILEEYADRLEGIGKMANTQVHLSISKDVKPVAQKTRRIPLHLRESVEQEIERLK